MSAEEKKAEEKKEEGHEAAEGEAKGKKKKLPILWVIIGLLAVLGSAGGTFLFMSMKAGDAEKGKKAKHAKGNAGEHEADAEGGEEHEGEEESHGGGDEEASAEEEHGSEEGHGGGGEEGQAHCPVHDAGGGGHGAKAPTYTDTYALEPFIVNLAGEAEKNFLKVTVKLKLAKAECTPLVDPHVAEMRDSVLLLLSSKNYDTIKTVQGKMELRDEILERIQHIVKGNKVKGAFFTEFVAQ